MRAKINEAVRQAVLTDLRQSPALGGFRERIVESIKSDPTSPPMEAGDAHQMIDEAMEKIAVAVEAVKF